MATLVLAAAGGAIGGAIGGSVLGIGAAVIGRAVGSVIGSVIDRRLQGGAGGNQINEGPRLKSLDVMTSQEGASLPQLWGRDAIAGQVIWATRLLETGVPSISQVGSGKQSQKVLNIEYRYSVRMAISLCEGPIRGIGRIWADGKSLDVSDLVATGRLRLYPGTETQGADGVIQAIEGDSPAYRGTAYLLFDGLDLTDFANRIPQIRVEVFGQSGVMESLVPGYCVIPGSTEWGYDPQVARLVSRGGQGEIITDVPENAARNRGISNWTESINLAQTVLPGADTLSLVVAWFGTDLRAGQCRIEPRVEFRGRDTIPEWSVGGLTRNFVSETSRDPQGRPAYGSTPSDSSVIRAIRDAKARGKRVVLYPFIMMDVKAEQGLPQPSGSGIQPDFPWRGRIQATAGQNAADEVAAFLGSAQRQDFVPIPALDAVTYSGNPSDFGFRRFILHLANLAKAAGGVDAFLVGSEMRGMTFSRAGYGNHPFVAGLQALAADVKAILGAGTKVSYAADWSEYHSFREGAEVTFHLDDFWADPNVDFVAIDNYLPMSDWRPGTDHADYNPSGPTSPHDLEYLKSQIEGGEYWHFYYASEADRAAQIRSPITPGPDAWVFRQKAIRDWWANGHSNRPGGTPSGATPWVAGSKPVWFTEIGCPATTYGTNQPNVFSARLSSESFLPYFSDGARDDFQQRQYIRAMLEWWRDNGGACLNWRDIQIWCWDARPWPEFPTAGKIWTDVQDWRLGHWLNGRAGAAPLAELALDRAARHGLTAADVDVSRAWGQASGFAIYGPTGFRSVIQPYEVAAAAAPREVSGVLEIDNRAAPRVVDPIALGDLVDPGEGSAPWSLARSALEDVAQRAELAFRDGLGNYHPANARAVIGAGAERGSASAETPLVFDYEMGQTAAERLLRAAVSGREILTAIAPPSRPDIVPGVVIPVEIDGDFRPYYVERVTTGAARQIEARAWDAAAWGAIPGPSGVSTGLPEFAGGSILLVPMDLPLLPRIEADPWDGYFASHASPWPGVAGISRSGSGEISPVASQAVIGETLTDLDPGRPWTWDRASTLRLKIYAGSLVTRPEIDVLEGANTLAIKHATGWEVLQFATADLQPDGGYILRDLIRGQAGTEPLARTTLPVGARVVLLDVGVQPAGIILAERNREITWTAGPARVDADTWAETTARFAGLGLKPHAPAQLSAAASGGDQVLTWVPRSRVPLGGSLSTSPALSDPDNYRLEIGPAGAPTRIETVSGRSFTWTAAMQAADALAAPVEIRVAQISDIYGPGWAAILEVTP